MVAGLIELQPAGAPGQLRLAVHLGAVPYLSVSRSKFCRLSIRAGQTTMVSERIGTVRLRGGEMTDVTLDRSGGWCGRRNACDVLALPEGGQHADPHPTD